MEKLKKGSASVLRRYEVAAHDCLAIRGTYGEKLEPAIHVSSQKIKSREDSTVMK